MPITVLGVGERELAVWLDHYLRRGYSCRLVERGAECRKRINEVMDHLVVIEVVKP